jgi:hypothetical protein
LGCRNDKTQKGKEEKAMIRSNCNPAASTAAVETAVYFGIEVDVISQMEHCSLIHYGHLTAVVDTADLVFARAMKTAA